MIHPGVIINHEYHVVELNNVRVPDEVFEWLQVKFGPGDGRRWHYRHPKIYFADRRDHMMFLLRWG